MIAGMRRLVALALLGSSACLSSQSYVCGDDDACVSSAGVGTCEATGYCSFPDAECGTGRRYAEFAGDGLAGLCVVEDGSSTSNDRTTQPAPATMTSGTSEGTTTTETGTTSVPSSESTGSITSDSTDASTSSSDSSTGPPPQPNPVFISSQTLAGAELDADSGDALCGQLATDAGLEGTYRAWFPSPDASAANRLGMARGWVRPDGLPFADTPGDIESGTLWYPLALDENGEHLLNVRVATGTGANGTTAQVCSEDSDAVTVGESASVSGTWTSVGTQSCEAVAHVYCFGIDHEFPIEAEVQSGRGAFVSSGAFTGSNGRTVFDDACETDAEEAGLDGSYLAFVPASFMSALSRFDLAGEPWINLRGQRIWPTADGLTNAGPLDTGVSTFADGTPATVALWTGASQPSAGNGFNCSNWLFPGLNAQHSRSGLTVEWFALPDQDPCTTEKHVLCFEQ